MKNKIKKILHIKTQIKQPLNTEEQMINIIHGERNRVLNMVQDVVQREKIREELENQDFIIVNDSDEENMQKNKQITFSTQQNSHQEWENNITKDKSIDQDNITTQKSQQQEVSKKTENIKNTKLKHNYALTFTKKDTQNFEQSEKKRTEYFETSQQFVNQDKELQNTKMNQRIQEAKILKGENQQQNTPNSFINIQSQDLDIFCHMKQNCQKELQNIKDIIKQNQCESDIQVNDIDKQEKNNDTKNESIKNILFHLKKAEEELFCNQQILKTNKSIETIKEYIHNISKLLNQTNKSEEIELIQTSEKNENKTNIDELKKFQETILKKDEHSIENLEFLNQLLKSGEADIQQVESLNKNKNYSWKHLKNKTLLEICFYRKLEFIQDACYQLVRDKYDDQKFLYYCESSNFEAVYCCIRNGVNLEQKNKNDWTALLIASYFGNTDIVDLLIKNKANIDAQTNFGTTALMLASEQGHLQVLEKLLINRANVNLREKSGRTALFKACINLNEDVIKLLIGHNADTKARSYGKVAFDFLKESELGVSILYDIELQNQQKNQKNEQIILILYISLLVQNIQFQILFRFFQMLVQSIKTIFFVIF